MDNNYDSPAFPIVEPDLSGVIASGLTKREWFAGMALQGLLAAKDPRNDEFVCVAAVDCADETLKQLQKKS
jgi:hypothetical protein